MAAVQAVLKVEVADPVAPAREKVAEDRPVLAPAAAGWDLESKALHELQEFNGVTNVPPPSSSPPLGEPAAQRAPVPMTGATRFITVFDAYDARK